MKFTKLALIGFLTFILSGCSVYMAAHQPSEKNVDLFKIGTPKSFLVAEFGKPVSTETRGGKKYDIYRFTQGYSGGAKAGRAFAEGVADVFTLGIAEIITTPVESIADGNLVAYEVSYDKNDLVDEVILLTANGSLPPPSQSATPPAPSAQTATPIPSPQLATPKTQ
jgi:hypothetical protein